MMAPEATVPTVNAWRVARMIHAGLYCRACRGMGDALEHVAQIRAEVESLAFDLYIAAAFITPPEAVQLIDTWFEGHQSRAPETRVLATTRGCQQIGESRSA